MILKNFLKLPPAPPSNESPRQKALRRTLGFTLMAFVFWWYWQSGEQPTQNSASQTQAILDQTGLLEKYHAEKLEQFAKEFHTTYGIPLMVHIYKHGTPAPCIPDSVCIRLFPYKGQSDFHAPPLVLSLLGKDAVNDLQYTHFPPYLAGGTWPEGLAAALRTITTRLDAALAPQPKKSGLAPSN
ncbi:hypothetical protein [Desulfovibrio cuneatus]|uniref:hypothetical protein n=1 Tax=Desulfovibrio cuneatus TaxID=159728 RepID=UPI00040F9A00|nr:hypothetical protein [Desulfovibrio cuneatus]